jgi:predicted transcriptional regulator
MWAANMAFSDRLIFQSVKELQGRNGVTATDIAIRAEISIATVKRGLDRLQLNGQIERKGTGRRWGYLYRIVEPAK